MVRKSISQMDKRMSMNKGFTLLESLLVLVVLSTITIGGVMIHNNNYLEYQIINELLRMQTQAILKTDKFCYENNAIHHPFPICYNGKGNINRSQTIYFNQLVRSTKLIIYLGPGKLYLQ